MQKLISKYGLAAHLAFLAVAPLFLSSTSVFWLVGLGFVWLVMMPSCIGGERLHEARYRVAGEIVRDPLFWFSLVFAGYALVRWLNGGVSLVYDAENAVWSLSKPGAEILPSSVYGHGRTEFIAALSLVVLLQGGRHALGKSARLAFLLLSSAISGFYAIIMVFQYHAGDAEAIRLSTCSFVEPSFVGSLMGVYLVASVVGLYAVMEEGWWRAVLLSFVAISGNLVGLALFAPVFVQISFVAGALILFAYVFVLVRKRMVGGSDFKCLLLMVCSVVLGLLLLFMAVPNSWIKETLETYETLKVFPEQFVKTRDTVSAICLRLWKSGPWLGTGLGSFPISLRFGAVEADWAVMSIRQAAPLNGYWLLLVECGIVGAFFAACMVGFLTWTYFSRLWHGIRTRVPHPGCWVGPFVLIVVLAETVVDVSYTVPGMLPAVASLFAISASFFPKGEN